MVIYRSTGCWSFGQTIQGFAHSFPEDILYRFMCAETTMVCDDDIGEAQEWVVLWENWRTGDIQSGRS